MTSVGKFSVCQNKVEMNKTEWVTFLHPFENVEREMKRMLCEIRRISLVLLGLYSLLYRINSNNVVLGKDIELIEALFKNILQCMQLILSDHLHKLLNVLEISALSMLCKVTSRASAFNLVEVY